VATPVAQPVATPVATPVAQPIAQPVAQPIVAQAVPTPAAPQVVQAVMVRDGSQPQPVSLTVSSTAQPGAAVQVSGEPPPPGAPPNGVWAYGDRYFGPVTCLVACLLGPQVGALTICCPCDQRDVYIVRTDGLQHKYDRTGKKVGHCFLCNPR